MVQKNINLITLILTLKMRYFVILLLLFCFSFVQAQNPEGSTGVELEQQVFEIARKVRCPVCRAESAADSNATTSIEFRNIIQEKLEEGQTEAEIIAFFQASYGDWILLDPPKRGLHLVVWIAPLVAALLAIIAFFILLRRWTQKANAAPVALSAAELEQVQNALSATSDYVEDDSATDTPDNTGATV